MIETNPLLDAARNGLPRSELVRTYAYAIPTPKVLRTIAGSAPPAGVVEIGAGTGYWAALLASAGVDVVAYDRDPPPSPRNAFFDAVEPWHPVIAGSEIEVDRHGDRLLLLVWPTKNEDWPGDVLERFHRAGGAVVAYVGTGPGGPTGDDRFHRILGLLDGCSACGLGVLDAPCTCHVRPLWQLDAVVPTMQWPGQDDRLHLFRRRSPGWADGFGRRWRTFTQKEDRP